MKLLLLFLAVMLVFTQRYSVFRRGNIVFKIPAGETEIAEAYHRIMTIPLFPKHFHSLTMFEQARFADPITMKYAHVDQFTMTQLSINDDWKQSACRIHETAEANLAYLAIHSNFKEQFTKQWKEANQYMIDHCLEWKPNRF